MNARWSFGRSDGVNKGEGDVGACATSSDRQGYVVAWDYHGGVFHIDWARLHEWAPGGRALADTDGCECGEVQDCRHVLCECPFYTEGRHLVGWGLIGGRWGLQV